MKFLSLKAVFTTAWLCWGYRKFPTQLQIVYTIGTTLVILVDAWFCTRAMTLDYDLRRVLRCFVGNLIECVHCYFLICAHKKILTENFYWHVLVLHTLRHTLSELSFQYRSIEFGVHNDYKIVIDSWPKANFSYHKTEKSILSQIR
jgi:hypothetical protein